MHCEIRPVRNFFAQRIEPAIVLYCKNPDEVFVCLHNISQSFTTIIDGNLTADDLLKPETLSKMDTTDFCDIEIKSGRINLKLKDGTTIFDCSLLHKHLNSISDLPENPKKPGTVVLAFVHDNMAWKDLTASPFEDAGKFFLASLNIPIISFKIL